MSQVKQILNHLNNYGHITPIIALSEYGCFRLAARIKNIRDLGYNIKTLRTKTGNKTYATYTLN